MKTGTEMAIEFCKNVMYKEDVIDCEEDDLLYNREMRKVIAILQQGEKYKAILLDLEGYSELNPIKAVRNIEDDRKFYRDMPAGLRISFKDKQKLISIANHYLCEYEKYYKFKQKHFPKEASHDVMD